MNKQDILNRIEDFSAEQLFEYIKQGVVTLEELRSTGELDASKRHLIVKFGLKNEREEDEFWNIHQKSKEGCQSYVNQYPNGKYIEKAKELLDNFIWAEYSNNISSYKKYIYDFPNGKYVDAAKEKISEGENILVKLRKNPNSYPSSVIRKHLKNGIISEEDLKEIGVPLQVIEKLNNIYESPDFSNLGDIPEKIPEGFSEVYFWGIRGSGKTTALAAVLSTANRLGYVELAEGPGYNYMLQLQNIFDKKISVLPSGTPDKTQYLPFTLQKTTEKNCRSVSLIELSGEIFQGFLYKNANKPFPTVEYEKTFNRLIDFLKSNNRKIHFFFIDYAKQNDLDQNNYTQANYLSAAAAFFNNPSNNVFRNTTDAIYVVVTKSDLMGENLEIRLEKINNYLQGNNFTGFINSLRNKCKEHSINNGKVLGTPFSLGKVYFNEICDFNDESAKNIIDILMRRIKPQKNRILDLFNK